MTRIPMLLALALPGVASSATLTVDDDGPADHATIGAAIAAANSGDTIEVAAGVYEENVLIAKSLTLLSKDGREETIIQGVSAVGSPGAVVIGPGTDNVVVGAEGRGFTIIGIDNGNPGIENAAVYLRGAHQNLVIAGNKIIAAGEAALLAEYNAAVTDVVIQGNIFSGQTFVGVNPAGDGFSQQFTLPNVPRQLVVLGGGSGGVNTRRISFLDNAVVGTAGGVNAFGNEQGNTLVTIDASESLVAGNEFAGTTTRFASALRCRRDTVIRENRFVGSGMGSLTVHLFVQNTTGDDFLIEGNAFLEGPGAGLSVGSGTGAVQARFNCFDTGTYGVASSAAAPIDAELNWWGDASGPLETSSNPDGTGDGVLGQVDFDPWLTAIEVTSVIPIGSALEAFVVDSDGVKTAAPIRVNGVPYDGSEPLPVGVHEVSAAAGCLTAMVVVVDPSGGFVTGGGWFDSPAGPDSLGVVWEQPFDSDTEGWFDAWSNWYGSATVVGDGTARFDSDGTSGPFTGFEGYHDAWTGTWVAEIDVYLDPLWEGGEGFDYAVAANGSDGLHQRDFIFHVGVVEDYGPISGRALLVNGSNNADFTTNPYKLVNENGGAYRTIDVAGWYTLQHVFRDAGGYLAVDLTLIDRATGTIVWTATRSTPADAIPAEVGGNRYGWFTHIEVDGGILVDNHRRYATGPLWPAGRASFGFVSKYRKGASTPTGTTQFVLQAAGLNFHSEDYEWLVVNKAGSRAQFKGSGVVNHLPAPNGDAYRFMVWATDGEPTDSPDTFRIRIWWDDADGTEHVVYDNGSDQPIGGGDIIVHTGGKSK